MIRSFVRRLAHDVRWGLAWGFIGGAGTCLWTYLLTIFDREGVLRHISETGFTLTSLMIAYLAAGTGGGFLLGLFRPWTKKPLGAMAVGVIVAIDVYAVLLFFMEGGRALLVDAPEWILLAALPAGGIAGLGTWRFFRDFEWWPGQKADHGESRSRSR